VLTSIHNVHFYQRIVREAREAIIAGCFDEHRREFLASYFGDTSSSGETSNSGEGSSPVETPKT
jgi:queuine/archaeosine tRNA-ribosyltransferase